MVRRDGVAIDEFKVASKTDLNSKGNLKR